MSFEHYNPVKVRFGTGVAQELVRECQARTLIVTGQATLRRAGLTGLAQGNARASSPVPPNPGDVEIDRLLGEAVEHGAETIVGLGGGSAMDAAKVVAQLVGNWDSLAACRAGGEDKPRRLRLVQVPTTAGTGSEVTRWASVWNDGQKSSVDREAGFADLALVDPVLSQGMPPRLALATGLDAMSHAMESLWGVHRTAISTGYATRCLSLVARHLPPLCSGKTAEGDYQGMAMASLLGGLALSCTRSAAAHALSYELTGRFGLEHGLAVGLLCRGLLRWNGKHTPEAVQTIVSAMGFPSLDLLEAFIDSLFLKAGLQPSLCWLGVPEEGFPQVVEVAAGSHRFANNAAALSREELLGLLEALA